MIIGRAAAEKYDVRCHAAFTVVIFERPPPDLPPAVRRKRSHLD